MRPCQGEGMIKTPVSGIYLEYGKDIRFKDVRITANESIRECYQEDVTLKHVSAVNF